MRASDKNMVNNIIVFWFGALDADSMPSEEAMQRWWQKDAEFDNVIKERFLPLVEKASAGELDDWLNDARGCLAYIILLDQFTRNMYRDSEAMYQHDTKAQAAAINAVLNGLDRELPLIFRIFVYMPFMHAESLHRQQQSLQCYQTLVDEADDKIKHHFEYTYNFAVLHKQIIERFGHFPHRNVLVNRATSAEEAEFLQEPDSSF